MELKDLKRYSIRDVQFYSFSSWIPYPTSENFFLDDGSFMAWKALFTHPLWNKITPLVIQEFGKYHLSWNWKMEKDEKGEFISVPTFVNAIANIPMRTTVPFCVTNNNEQTKKRKKYNEDEPPVPV